MPDSNLNIRVYPLDEPKSSTVAFANISVGNLVAIRGIRVIDSASKGKFVSMPQAKNKDGGYDDVAFPLNADLRKQISAEVLQEYDTMASLAPDQRGYDKPDAAAKNIIAADVKLDIRVHPIANPQGELKAFASVGIDDLIAIRGVRVVEMDKGLSMVMPQSQDKDGKSYDVAFPLNGDLRKEITKIILNEYKEKSAEKSLANGLRKGAEKAAEHSPKPPDSSRKAVGAAEH